VFTGLNASGKTSLLEAVYVLAAARSFRNTPLQDLINDEHKGFTVTATLDLGSSALTRIGVQKKRQESVIAKRDGEFLKRVSDLAYLLPAIVIDPDSFMLVEGSPSYRRDFLNMGMFHVEHHFRDVWRSFSKALKQRNVLLKNSIGASQPERQAQLNVWTDELCRYAEVLQGMRAEFVTHFIQYFLIALERLSLADCAVEIEYKPGWDISKPLKEVLSQNRQRELALGSTLYGPHKADLVLSNKRLFSRDYLSRGQKKLLVYAMRFALADYIANTGKRRPVLLLDDLPAELDDYSSEAICSYLSETPETQTLITAVSTTRSLERIIPILKPRMFHVDHGEVSLS
jgi:DNA replication and repair protein RecF